ncbi:MAG: ribonuclease P protein component 1 [Candidatus Thorarchaeota archaeon]|jgi:ribonuclease P protein subunit POP4
MKITPANLTRHELIGLETHVVRSSDPGHVCKKGLIVDESKEMIHISTETGKIMVPKMISVFDFKLPQGIVVRVEGHKLMGTPENRIKKRQSRRW